MLFKNAQLKAERSYTDPDSFVRDNGSEVLKGDDWRERKLELHRRSQGRCERFTVLHKAHDAFCYGEGGEPHHIVPRWPTRDDRLSNLADLSHACHRAEDERKIGGRHAR